MAHTQRIVDPCMYNSKQENGELSIISSWVGDNIIIRPDHIVDIERTKIGNLKILIVVIWPLNKFVGCKV